MDRGPGSKGEITRIFKEFVWKFLKGSFFIEAEYHICGKEKN